MPRTLQPLCDTVAGHGDRTVVLALRRGERVEWSGTRLASHARRLAAGLLAAGLKPGEPVALLAEDRPEWIATCLGVLRAGAVVAPLDVQFDDDALTHVLRDSEARFLFTTTAELPRLRRLQHAPRHIVLLDAPAGAARSWQALLADAETTRRTAIAEVAPQDPAALFYTSGTTGRPKGVPLTHGNLASQLNTLIELDLLEHDDRMLLPLPLHHVYPFVIGLLMPLHFGLPLVLPQSLTGPELVRALKDGRVTVIVGVPRLYRALIDGLQTQAAAGGRLASLGFRTALGTSIFLRRRLGLRIGRRLLAPVHERLGPRVRVVVSGGAALDPDLAWTLEGLGWQLGTGYGLTETSPMLTLDRPGAARLGSVGRPLPGVEIRIVAPPADDGDSRGQRGAHRRRESVPPPTPLRDGQTGEIQARGPNVFSGYRNLPEKTAEVFTDDGWFRTADLGRFDAGGWLHIEGRSSELIKTESGEKVQPEELEKTLAGSPALREVAILQADGKLVALAVPAGAATTAEADAQRATEAAVNERSRHLPSYARITAVAVTREPLPRTRLGKLRRHLLAELFERARRGGGGTRGGAAPLPVASMSADDQALLASPAARRTWELLARRHAHAGLTPDSNLQLDLDVDSMEWLNLTLDIRRHAGVELDDAVLARLQTVRDLLRAVGEVGGRASAPRASPLEEPEAALTREQKRWLRRPSRLHRAASRAAWVVNRVIARLFFRVHAEGLQNLPADGPLLLAPNHGSYVDAPLLAAVLDAARLRRTWWAAWTGFTGANAVGRLVARLGQMLPIDQERGAASSLAFGAVALKRGHTLVWFPEGQRTTDGTLQEFKAGVGLLLQHVPVPVVPVWIEGSWDAWPPGRWLPRPRRVTVSFGKALDPSELRGGHRGEPSERIAHALRLRVAALGRRAREAHGAARRAADSSPARR